MPSLKVITPIGIMLKRKGYSGTAIFSKVKPLSVTYGLGIEEHDHEGRVITLELESFLFDYCVYSQFAGRIATVGL